MAIIAGMSVHFYPSPFDPLNNFSAHAIEFEGILYPTSEHAYQTAKCLDQAGKKAIRSATSPHHAKRLANQTYAAHKDPDWDTKKVQIMEAILRVKLAQHEDVAEALDRSGQDEIIENSPKDYFWGEGADRSGKNTLGKLWMKLRAEKQAAPNRDSI